MKYLKLFAAIILFEVTIGKIGYEYGYAHDGNPSGISSWYFWAFYALIYLSICLVYMWHEPFGLKIFSVVYILGMFVFCLVNTIIFGVIERELSFAIALMVLLGIALILEIVTLILGIRQRITEKIHSK